MKLVKYEQIAKTVGALADRTTKKFQVMDFAAITNGWCSRYDSHIDISFIENEDQKFPVYFNDPNVLVVWSDVGINGLPLFAVISAEPFSIEGSVIYAPVRYPVVRMLLEQAHRCNMVKTQASIMYVAVPDFFLGYDESGAPLFSKEWGYVDGKIIVQPQVIEFARKQEQTDLGIVENSPALEKILNTGREYYKMNQLPEYSCEYVRVFRQDDIVNFKGIHDVEGKRVISPTELCWNIYDNVKPYGQKPCRDGVSDFIATL